MNEYEIISLTSERNNKKLIQSAQKKIIKKLINDGLSASKAEEKMEIINSVVINELDSLFKIKGKLGKHNTDFSLLIKSINHSLIGLIMKGINAISCHSLGDTLGYRNSIWEFNDKRKPEPELVNSFIYEFINLGGIIDINIKTWMASDDTIMYLDTLDVMIELFVEKKMYENYDEKFIDLFGTKLREKYLSSLPKLRQRHIGNTTNRSLDIQKNIKWNELPYNSTDIGAGSAMRSGCLGLFFCGEHLLNELIAYSVECSRITHNSAIAILGSFAFAYFTSLAILQEKIENWPRKLLDVVRSDKIDNYIKKTRPKDFEPFVIDKTVFISRWEEYISKRFTSLITPINNEILKNPVERFRFFMDNFSKGHQKNVGSCGDDAVIMAYDSLLESGDNIEKLIVYSILHPGDSDTVGCIALSLYGALYGYVEKNSDIFTRLFGELEYHDKIFKLNTHFISVLYYHTLYYEIAIKYL